MKMRVNGWFKLHNLCKVRFFLFGRSMRGRYKKSIFNQLRTRYSWLWFKWLISFINLHSFSFHHAFGFFYKCISQFSCFEQKKADAVFAVVDGFAFIINCTEFFGDVYFNAYHSGSVCGVKLSDCHSLHFWYINQMLLLYSFKPPPAKDSRLYRGVCGFFIENFLLLIPNNPRT